MQYTSSTNDFNLSWGYGLSNNAFDHNVSAIGIFEVIGNKDTYKKTDSIYVVEK